MILGYVCEIAAVTTVMGFVDAYAQTTNTILEGLYICADVRGPSFYQEYLFWLPFIVYDGMLCMLALWHGISSRMSGYHAKWKTGIYVADILIKGNVGYFLCLLVASMISIVIGQFLAIQWTEVSQAFPATIESMIACRLILDLRSSLVRQVEKNAHEMVSDMAWSPVIPPSEPLDYENV